MPPVWMLAHTDNGFSTILATHRRPEQRVTAPLATTKSVTQDTQDISAHHFKPFWPALRRCKVLLEHQLGLIQRNHPRSQVSDSNFLGTLIALYARLPHSDTFRELLGATRPLRAMGTAHLQLAGNLVEPLCEQVLDSLVNKASQAHGKVARALDGQLGLDLVQLYHRSLLAPLQQHTASPAAAQNRKSRGAREKPGE